MEADYALYNQVHFNGTLQRKFVNYDCFTSKDRIDKLVALQGDGVVREPSDPATPLWTIVDGPGTDGRDIKRMLEVSRKEQSIAHIAVILFANASITTMQATPRTPPQASRTRLPRRMDCTRCYTVCFCSRTSLSISRVSAEGLMRR